MPANDAPGRSAKHAVTTGEVPHSPAYQCAPNASFGMHGRPIPRSASATATYLIMFLIDHSFLKGHAGSTVIVT